MGNKKWREKSRITEAEPGKGKRLCPLSGKICTEGDRNKKANIEV